MDNSLKWGIGMLVVAILGIVVYNMVSSTNGLSELNNRENPSVADTAKKEGEDEMAEDEMAEEEMMEEDTTGTEENEEVESGDEEEKKLTPPPPQDQIAPGRAKVRFELKEIQSDEGSTHLTVTVLEVMGYGSATPVIATESRLLVDATSYFTGDEHDTGEMQTGSELKGLLEHQEQPIGGGSRPSWQLIDILN